MRNSKMKQLESCPLFQNHLRSKYALAYTVSNDPNAYLIYDNRCSKTRLTKIKNQTTTGYLLFCTQFNKKVITMPWHRVAYFLGHGEFPKQTVNHKDENKHNNSLDNLEDVSLSSNLQSRNRSNRTNTYVGVRRQKNKWVAAVALPKSKKVYLGSFVNEVDAAKAWDEYVVKHNLNRKLNFEHVEATTN